jgi:hypothetical protein
MASPDAYCQLKAEFDGNYYVVKDEIKFSFNNAYSVEKLDYVIVDLASNIPVKYYPEIVVKTGLNRISIDVDDCRGLKKGKQYILRAKNINITEMQMNCK